jgi:hypothetical protein
MGTQAYDYATHPESYFSAFHWDGSQESTDALAAFVGDPDKYGRCDFFEVETDDGVTIRIEINDYVIADYSGRFAVMTQDAFEDYFTRV